MKDGKLSGRRTYNEYGTGSQQALNRDEVPAAAGCRGGYCAFCIESGERGAAGFARVHKVENDT